jgi:hypothetical protein
MSGGAMAAAVAKQGKRKNNDGGSGFMAEARQIEGDTQGWVGHAEAAAGSHGRAWKWPEGHRR